jgi:toxin ParE1/3/4
MVLKWTRGALRNLQEVADYIASDNPKRAASFVMELRDKTDLLTRFPALGRPGRIVGSRELVLHRNYLAIYRVVRDEVQILRIHHVARRLGT